jgi:AAA+ superfamily predicted ATPase
MKDSYPGNYYEKQLTRAPTPNFKHDFFSVEKVLGQKTVKNKKYFLVKFLFYPSKFNQYIPEENLKVGEK